MNLADFKAARYMEAFLDGTPPECQLACSQSFVIAALSDTPSIPVPTEEEVTAAWVAFRRPRQPGRQRPPGDAKELPPVQQGLLGGLWKWLRGG
jgi:hypothetical protein